VTWYSWPNLSAFTVWHDAACAALGIPHPGRNAATNNVDENAQWTTAYTDPFVGSDVRAYVEQDVAEIVPEGLGVLSVAPEDTPDAGDA